MRRKLPSKCGRYFIHETAHIQSVYIKISSLVAGDDGVTTPADTETHLAGQDRYNADEEAVIHTENGGVLSSTSRLMAN